MGKIFLLCRSIFGTGIFNSSNCKPKYIIRFNTSHIQKYTLCNLNLPGWDISCNSRLPGQMKGQNEQTNIHVLRELWNSWGNRPFRSHRGPPGAEKFHYSTWDWPMDSFWYVKDDNNNKKNNTQPTLLSHPNIKVQTLNIGGWITELVSTEVWYFLSRNRQPFHHSGHLNFKGSLASGKLICHRPQRILYKRNQLYCFSLFFQARTILILPEPSQAANKHRLFVWRLSAHHTRKRGRWQSMLWRSSSV